jgi:hypothetical protein
MNTQETIDQRLDALDRALLGLLPRSERLEFVAGVQARLETQPAESLTATEAALCQPAAVASSVSRRRQRSATALTAGVLGIVSLALLFALPVTYLIVAAASEAIGELVTYTLLSANILVVALAGGAAIVLGIVALVRLARQRGQLGHGWAITGLCTGPLPALAGGLGMIAFVLPLMAELADSGVSTVPCATATCYAPAPSDAPPVGMQVQVVANSPYPSAPAQAWAPMPLTPSAAPSTYGEPPGLPAASLAPAGATLTAPGTLPGNAEKTPSNKELPSALPADTAPSALQEKPAAISR